MTDLIEAPRLPAMVQRAAAALAGATTSAEVLDARDLASVAYDAAKSAARIARAKGAYDDVIGAVYRAQADALEIEAAAKRRLADEYDGAQERGEVKGPGNPSGLEALPSATDLGLSHKDIHEAREIRDAELADPGIVRRTLDSRIKAGQEPTKASLRNALRGYVPEPALIVPDQSLALWGQLREMERDGLLDAHPPTLMFGMTEGMRADVLRVASRLIGVLAQVVSAGNMIATAPPAEDAA